MRNPAVAAMLTSAEGQVRLADAIVAALVEWFAAGRPSG